jgi:hypothetical protein
VNDGSGEARLHRLWDLRKRVSDAAASCASALHTLDGDPREGDRRLGEKVPKLETCPQRVSDAAGGQVTWALDGDPADGSRVTYQDGRFDVVGHAVMTVSYDSCSGTPRPRAARHSAGA